MVLAPSFRKGEIEDTSRIVGPDVAQHLRRLVSLSLATGLAALLVGQTPTPDEPRVIPLRVHDVCRSMSSGEPDAWLLRHAELLTDPCAPEDWLDAQIATASSLFAPAGLQFRSSEQLGLAPEHARIDRVVGLWRLADQATGRFGVDVFLVDEMFSSADAGGTGWAERRGPRLVVVAVTSANRALLAHELGHFFGLAHSADPANPMFDAAPGEGAFDPDQMAHLRAQATSFRPPSFDTMGVTFP
jgi:hypothetical protein